MDSFGLLSSEAKSRDGTLSLLLTNLHLHLQPARPQQGLVYQVGPVGHTWGSGADGQMGQTREGKKKKTNDKKADG